MLSHSRTLAVLLLSSCAAWATTYSRQGPTYAKGPNEGKLCTPGTAFCVIGDERFYQVWSADLVTSDTLGVPWLLTIATNYGDPSKTILPGTPYAYEGVNFTNGDFLIMWNSLLYGIALSAHDGYTPGNLYRTDSYQTSGSIMSGLVSDVPNPSHPVLIGAGGNLIGAGTMSSARTGDAVTAAAYTITVSFTPPTGFLATGPFSIDFSSYACANGVLHGTGERDPGVPEPATGLLLASGLIVLGAARTIRVRKQRP